jgi:S-adenosylmethionine-diacylglycerol 3-amino-3-carboxypropyl transferase
MKSFFSDIRKSWFEVRIFISLSIVLVISFVSFFTFKTTPTTIEIVGSWLGLSGRLSIYYGYFLIAFIVLLASLIRMWAGSILTSKTVMAFKIQDSKFLISGPYNFVRNPIYLADLIAFTALSVCLKPIGLLIPILIYLHYYQLIKYEEKKLKIEFDDSYTEYLNSTPAIFPGVRQFILLFKNPLNFSVNFDGFRHNAQYILFIPGLIISAYTGKFIHAILIGLPAVIDWAVIHTIIGLSKDTSTTSKKKKFSRSKVFKDILYAQCWEDPELDRIAFEIKPEDIILSITSGGCNALSFLIDDPKEIICLDMNKYQNYLLSLKINSFKSLTHNEVLEFFGIISSNQRWGLFEKVRPLLSEEEQLYWSNKRKDINRGIIHCGRYERYMHLLKQLFKTLVGQSIINDLFNTRDLEARKKLFEKRWENHRWRLFCRIFLSRTFASQLFDKAFYKYLDKGFSFEKYYRSAVKRAITELPLEENYFLAYMLLGNYFKNNYPAYLKLENFDMIRNRVNRIQSINSGCLEYFKSLPSDSISKFNFTNIFEWMSLAEFSTLLKETVRVAKDGATITYRNHLVTRNRPESLANQIIPDKKLSAELHERDLSFIYKAYVVERIQKR